MTVLQLVNQGTPAQEIDLAELLAELARFGKPRLGIYGSDGLWHCSVEMNVSAVGVKFEAKSEYKHATAMEAALVCRDRIRAALASMRTP